jgi:hypothetical protein
MDKKMSIFEKSKILLKKTLVLKDCYHYGLKSEKNNAKICYDKIKKYFCKKLKNKLLSNNIAIMATFLSGQNPNVFDCKLCDYSTTCSKDFKKHTETKKHIRNNSQHLATNCPKNPFIVCDNCQKKYKDRSGLWRHKKKCIAETVGEAITTDDNLFSKEMMMQFIQSNMEFQKMIIEVMQKGVYNTNNNTISNCNNTINTSNKTFNLNVYLNETCKDAMNISDFVNSIKINLEDLENTGRKGYVEGISHIFLKNLNNMEHHMRPFHCSDYKREILYIKNNDKWEKECDDKPILTKAIKTVANQNIKQIRFWRDKNPDCTKSESRKNDLYLKIVSNSMN